MHSEERMSKSGWPLQRAGIAGNRYGAQIEDGPGGTVPEQRLMK